MSSGTQLISGAVATNKSQLVAGTVQGSVYFGYSQNPNDLLKTLPNAADAQFNAFRRQHDPTCHRDTRRDLLQKIYNWADGLDKPCIFWLSGLAGTGKSTIARTVAAKCSEKGSLGASFFFSRGGGDIGHAGKFVTSIAVQLANKIPALKRNICDAIAERSDIVSQSLRDQWRHLVLRPLSKLEGEDSYVSYILVVDALDECNGDNNIRLILQLLTEARSLGTVRLQVFLTSRPDIPIRLGFYQISDAEHQDFVLHDISSSIVDQDISVFLRHSLRLIGQEQALGDGWLDAEITESLVQKAGGLFLWAATACRFISEGPFAEERLRTILEGVTSATATEDYINRAHITCLQEVIRSLINAGTLFIWAATACGFVREPRFIEECSRPLLEDSAITPEHHLNSIYITVLQSSIRPAFTKQEAKKVYSKLRDVLGSIVTLFSPLSIKSLSRLLAVTEQEVGQTLKELHAILNIPKNQTHLLRLHHPSFRDFLLDKKRREDSNFWVDEKQAHRKLAYRCIQLMSTSLTKDICGVALPGTLVTNVEYYRIEQCLPLEVRYACLYWVQHLQQSGAQLYDKDPVYKFLQVHLLHWLEALGWMGKTSEGILAIYSLEALILPNKSPKLHAFIHDAKRFALINRLVVEQAPLQLYCSALVFAPEESVIRTEFKKHIPPWMQRKSKVQANWNAALQTLEGHTDGLTSVAFSPDGKQVVSGSYDKTVRLWDARTGAAAAVPTLEGHTDRVTSVAFSPDGKRVVSGSRDKTVRLWDPTTGAAAAVPILEGHTDGVTSVAFSLDGKQVVSGSDDKTVRLWDAATKAAALLTLKGHTNKVTSVAFSLDSKQVVSGSRDKTIRLWDASTGAVLLLLKGHTDAVTSVAFSPGGGQVVSGSRDKTVRLWDTVARVSQNRTVTRVSQSRTAAKVVLLPPPFKGHADGVTSVAFSPDGKQVVSGSYDKTVRLWDAATGAALPTLQGHTDKVTSIAFSPDNRRVVSSSCDKTIWLWDIAIKAILPTLKGHMDGVTSIAFSLDGRRVVSGSNDKIVRLWDAIAGAALLALEGHKSVVTSVAFSPDGRRVISSSNDKTVRLWDAATGAALLELKGHKDWVTSVAFSPDGKRVISGSRDKTVRLWDTIAGVAPFVLEGHTNGVTSIAFSPNGKQIVSGSRDKTIRLWNANTRASLPGLKGHTRWVTSVAFSLDNKQVVSGSRDMTVRLWDAATRATLLVLKGHIDWVTSVAFSPNGKQVVSGSCDETIRLWDAVAGIALPALQGHTDGVTSIAFSPDGKQVVSGSDDNTVCLWDTATRAALPALEGYTNGVTSMAFSLNGKQVVSSCNETMRLWNAVAGVVLLALEGYIDGAASVAFSLNGKQLPTLLVSNNWVIEGDTKILWLPPDYRSPTCVAVWNGILALGYSSGRISVLGFQEGSKVL